MDDARLGDEMTLERIASELTAIREKLETHDGMFEALAAKLVAHDGKFESIEAKLVAHDRKFEALEAKLVTHDGKFESHDGKFESLGSKFESLNSKFESLDARMRMGFEETHRLLKLGFESVQILDERVGRRFDETERQHADHKILIEAAVKRLRRDAELSQPPTRRRR